MPAQVNRWVHRISTVAGGLHDRIRYGRNPSRGISDTPDNQVKDVYATRWDRSSISVQLTACQDLVGSWNPLWRLSDPQDCAHSQKILQ